MSATVLSTSTTNSGPSGQPDISYVPDPSKWRARAAQRVKVGGLPSSVPEGFPKQLTGDLVWEGGSIAEIYDWTYVLDNSQLDEIDLAVTKFKCTFGHMHVVCDRWKLKCIRSTGLTDRSHFARHVSTSYTAYRAATPFG